MNWEPMKSGVFRLAAFAVLTMSCAGRQGAAKGADPEPPPTPEDIAARQRYAGASYRTLFDDLKGQLGLVPDPDPGLMTKDVLKFSEESNNELVTQALKNWCLGNHGRDIDDSVIDSPGAYFFQRFKDVASGVSLTGCDAAAGRHVVVILWGPNPNKHASRPTSPLEIAFYDPPAWQAFYAKWVHVDTSDHAASVAPSPSTPAAQIDAPEPHGAGPSVAETMAAIAEIRQDDPMAHFSSLNYQKSCRLVVNDIVLDLAKLRLGVLNQIETLTTSVIDVHTSYYVHVDDGRANAKVGFESQGSASRLVNAVSHLGELCGASRPAF